MKKLVCLSILLSSFTGCSTMKKPEKVLEKRAAYFDEVKDVSLGLNSTKFKRKIKSFSVYAWRHEDELPNGDYFLGGWLELVIK